jgi:molecular chaperone GrpE
MVADFSNQIDELHSVEMSAAPKDSDSAGPAPVPSEPVRSLEDAEKELAAAKDQFLRLAAEFENYKKISLREKTQGIQFANTSIIESLLPVIDSLEQAALAGKDSADPKTQELVTGVNMVLKIFADTLKKFGAESFTALGQKFDPASHEAVAEQESADVEPGTVLLEYQKGFIYNGRLLRPARVVVAKTPQN